MRAIQTLCDEHGALRQVLDALELVLDCQRRDDHLETSFAIESLEWLERFADGLHQDREEFGLFPRLEQRAPARTRDLLSGLVRWHATERDRLQQMRAQIEGAAYGDPLSRDSFTVAARAYIEFQRRHSAFEDSEILPLARAVLTPEDDAIITAEYSRLEQLHLRSGELHPTELARQIITRTKEWVLEQQPSLSSNPVARSRVSGNLRPRNSEDADSGSIGVSPALSECRLPPFV
jgi:hemerythrin-like domain-containing protein